MNEKILSPNPNPMLKASIFSKATFSWMGGLLKLGRKKQLQLEDLYEPLPVDESTYLIDELEDRWNKELKTKKKPNIGSLMLKWFWLKLSLNSLFIILQEVIKIFQPLLISYILDYFNGSIQLREAIYIAIVISISAIVVSVLHHPYYYFVCCFGTRLRLASSGLIYRKALKLNINTLQSKSAGDIINLLSTDGTRIEYGVYYIPYLITGPIQAIIVAWIIYHYIGFTFLIGLSLLAIIYPIKYITAKVYNKFRIKNCKMTDERISVLTELLNNIKIIKMYCWETPFSKNLIHLRKKELHFQMILNMLASLSATIDTVMATLMTFVNIAFFLGYLSSPLLPSYMVFSIGFYMRLCASMGMNFTRALTMSVNYFISAKRINQFLLLKEFSHSVSSTEKKSQTNAIEVENLGYKWDTVIIYLIDSILDDYILNSLNKKDKEGFSLKNISIKVKKGDFVGVVGPVGSGKTTILLAILNELENYTGKVSVNGKVFYISQQPWVFTATIKQNITFGKPFDKEKFDRVVEACSLRKDLDLLVYGENTLVGEKGMNLSGGQRARICMARALYSDSDIYLFDDSLSAVDGTVAKDIVKNCINGYLKNKTRILVTHQVHHLETAENIVIIKNGQIESKGKYDELAKTSLKSYITEADEERDDEKVEEENEVEKELKVIKKKEKVMTEEMKAKEELIRKEREEGQQQGAVSLKAYKAYFTSGSGIFGVIFVVFLFLAGQLALVGTDYWLSTWASNEENYMLKLKDLIECQSNSTYLVNCHNITSEYHIANSSDLEKISNIYDKRSQSFKIYIGLTCLSVVCIGLRSVIFFALSLQNSKKIYNKMFFSVRDTFVRFFELNPIGRIINRFSKDTNNMDEMLVFFLYEFLQTSMVIFGALLVPIVINPWMLLPLIVLGFIFNTIKNYFMPTARELKRLDNIGRSPIFVHTNSSIEGIVTIRADHKEEILKKEFEMLYNNHTRAYFGFLVAHRWFGMRLDFLCALYTIFTLFGCIFLKDNLGISSGQIGLLMVYLFQLFDLFQWCVVLMTFVENLMTSVERIIEYTSLEREPLDQYEQQAPDDWPNRGQIVFKNVSLKYDENLPPVLKNISLNILPGEKIGIVGRTGAGKSSFFLSIFRMYQPTGNIYIDDVEIKTLSLSQLRTKLTIIPQEPILFSGSVRINLDPFNQYSDSEIWHALESTGLKSVIGTMSGGLEAKISSGGTNLSIGQKQLFCLSRAILKKTKILIIDEATANVDYKTDAIIQKTIREQFKNCTVLTIAHRLATVADSDRILCLSEGEVKNFGKPKDLLADKTSILYELTEKLSKNERTMIQEIALGNIDPSKLFNDLQQSAERVNVKGAALLQSPRTQTSRRHCYFNQAAQINDEEDDNKYTPKEFMDSFSVQFDEDFDESNNVQFTKL